MALFLTSLGFSGLRDWLWAQGIGGSAVLIDNASHELPDAEAVVARALAELAAEGLQPARLNVLRDDPAALERAGIIVMSGGDPFRLLADLRASGADRRLIEAHRRDVPIVGQSAGAMVCGPDLAPLRITSPFPAPADLDLAGLGLCAPLVLPHHDRPGRAALHRRAALELGGGRDLRILWDDESLHLDSDGAWTLHRADGTGAGCRTRLAGPDDAHGVAEVFHQATLAAWAHFVAPERLAGTGPDTAGWQQRIVQGGHRFLVGEDTDGIAAFVWYHQAANTGTDVPTGEVDMLYTHPRAWGRGIGLRLLHRATWHLLCEGFREAILWTEARNAGALALYHRAGWVADGAVDERTYLGAPLRNLRHRLDLTRHAGGP